MVLILVGGILYLATKNKNLNNQQSNTDNEDISLSQNILSGIQYKAFVPLFNTTSESNDSGYDYTQDMDYQDKIYIKKINTYEEYTVVKKRWDDILLMTEDDFNDCFMAITAIENTSMLGLKPDSVEADDNNLYISLIHYNEDEHYNEKETCISYIIPRTMERENIYVTRNLNDNEKDMSTEVKLQRDEESGTDLKFIIRDEQYRKLEKSINSGDNTIRLIPQDWQDIISVNFSVNKNDADIDFSKWNDLGNGFYSLEITKYSDYLKMMNNYSNTPKLNWLIFKYLYPIIIVRNNADRTIAVSDIETLENNEANIYLYEYGVLDVTENFKYPGAIVFVPNYRSLNQYRLNLKVK